MVGVKVVLILLYFGIAMETIQYNQVYSNVRLYITLPKLYEGDESILWKI